MGDGFSRFTPGYFPGGEVALQDQPQEARVVSVTGAGAMVELTALPGATHGPAPWPLGSSTSPPAAITGGFYPHVGDRCLVVFAGVGIGAPWVLAWWR